MVVYQVESGDGETKSITVSAERQGICIRPEGTGCFDGEYGPIYIEFFDGKPRIVVWADINEEDCTNIIELDGALESARIADSEESALTA